MSLYSNGSIKSVIIDPSNYRANARAEFRLDGDRLYKSDLKLANMGLSVSDATNTPVNNKLAGVGALIKSVRLLDGKTELDSCAECHRYYGFQQLLDENSGNESMNRYLVNNSQGLRTSEIDKQVVNLKPPQRLTIDPTTTPQGIIDLRDCLPLLRSLDLLDSESTFKNLRLHVEFETDRKLIASDVEFPLTTLEPVLLCDVIEDPMLISSMQKQMPPAVQWNAIEHDVFSVKAAAANGTAVSATTQPVSQKIRGFDNKRVGRLLAVKTYSVGTKLVTGNAVADVGNLSSIAGYDEVFNVRVNGKNILARKGNEKAPNQRLAMLVDAYGDMASYYGSNLVSIDEVDERVADGVKRGGRLDYFGIVINESVQDLQFSYERTHIVTANDNALRQAFKANAGLDVHLYGEVAKTLTMGPNGYSVSYV